jgi:hypothetical protein
MNARESMPFMQGLTAESVFARPDVSHDSLDLELFDELGVEIIEYLMQEYNEGHYDPMLIQAFLMTKSF